MISDSRSIHREASRTNALLSDLADPDVADELAAMVERGERDRLSKELTTRRRALDGITVDTINAVAGLLHKMPRGCCHPRPAE